MGTPAVFRLQVIRAFLTIYVRLTTATSKTRVGIEGNIILIPNNGGHLLYIFMGVILIWSYLYFIANVSKTLRYAIIIQRVTNQGARHSICPDIFSVGVNHHMPKTFSCTTRTPRRGARIT